MKDNQIHSKMSTHRPILELKQDIAKIERKKKIPNTLPLLRKVS